MDKRALAALPEDTWLEIYPIRKRSSKQNRYAHALMHRAADNSPDNWTEEAIKKAVKQRGGFFEGVLHRRNGDQELIYRSTADFDKDEMSRFIELLLQYIVEVVAPQIDVELLKAEAWKDAAPNKHGMGHNSRHRREEEMA